jgi:hypothetical protein
VRYKLLHRASRLLTEFRISLGFTERVSWKSFMHLNAQDSDFSAESLLGTGHNFLNLVLVLVAAVEQAST